MTLARPSLLRVNCRRASTPPHRSGRDATRRMQQETGRTSASREYIRSAARTGHNTCSTRPKHQPEGDSDQSVANDGGTHRGPGSAALPCRRRARSDIRRRRSGDCRSYHAATAVRSRRRARILRDVHVWKRIYERDQAHHAADSRPSEAEDPLLITRADGRQRHDEAGDPGGVDPRIVEAVNST